MSAPIPPDRGRWRLTLNRRQFTDASPSSTVISDLLGARSRKLERQLNTPAVLSFTIDGRSDAALWIKELETDVYAWRWDETQGKDIPYFMGVVGQTEDQLTEQSYTINVTCHDYLAMFMRRYLAQPLSFTGLGQDSVINQLYRLATDQAASSSGVSLWPGSYLPISPTMVAPDGSPRATNGGAVPTRDRTYPAQSDIGTLLDDLAHVQNGFDYDCLPQQNASYPFQGPMRIFFPSQGVARANPILEYGSTVRTVTRSVNSSNYANYVRLLGNNGATDPAAPQLFAETWNSDANNVGARPIGLWQDGENASDVSVQSTLNQQVAGYLNLNGVLIPSYTLVLSPGVFFHNSINMGDNMTLVIRKGRLKVDTAIRVVGVTFDISDDGTESVGLTVGRPLTDLANMLAAGQADINALARR
jgi:hypothetical protein